jgi:hypothetical protein
VYTWKYHPWRPGFLVGNTCSNLSASLNSFASSGLSRRDSISVLLCEMTVWLR